jgi:hypothetical protein
MQKLLHDIKIPIFHIYFILNLLSHTIYITITYIQLSLINLVGYMTTVFHDDGDCCQTKIKKIEGRERADTDTMDTKKKKKDNSAFTINLMPDSLSTTWKTENAFEKELLADIDSDNDMDILKRYQQIHTFTELDQSLNLLPATSPANKCMNLPYLVHPLKPITRTTKIITQAPSEFSIEDPDSLEIYTCKLCKEQFNTGQALGGHMSRKHPGLSTDYIHKKEIRDKRDVERKKLFLAKIKFFESLGLDYMKLRSSSEGRKTIRTCLNRSKLKRLKQDITCEEVDKEFKFPV